MKWKCEGRAEQRSQFALSITGRSKPALKISALNPRWTMLGKSFSFKVNFKWLVFSAVLLSADIEYFHYHRKFYWTALLEYSNSSSTLPTNLFLSSDFPSYPCWRYTIRLGENIHYLSLSYHCVSVALLYQLSFIHVEIYPHIVIHNPIYLCITSFGLCHSWVLN